MTDVTDSALDAAIDALARDVVPAIEAVRTQPQMIPPTGLGLSGLWMTIMRAILQSPARNPAEQAVQQDAVLAPVIREQKGYTSTAFGSGSVFQAATLPLELVQAGCFELLVRGRDVTPDALAQASVENTRKLRAGLSGNEIEGWCLIAFGALALQSGSLVHTPWGDLVNADRLTSEIWNDPAGRCTAVLATPVTMKLEPLDVGQMPSATFHAEAYRIAQLVSYGIALGSDRDDPAAVVPLHTGGLLPWGMPGWGSEIHPAGFTSRSAPLSSAEATETARWMTDLEGAPIDRIDVALRRVVRGLAERLDHADQLIDAVIAWENLVEHRDKPTGSVLWGIRKLAGPSGWSNTQIGNIYKTRSDVVHGEQPDYPRVIEHAPQALKIGLDALRALFEHYRDTLPLSSEDRVIALGYELPESATSQ